MSGTLTIEKEEKQITAEPQPILAFKKDKFTQTLWFIFLIGAFIGAVFFILIYGYKILDFTYTDWIFKQEGNDIVQHQLGFQFFRNADWQFPIGCYNSYGDGTSIVYTDSIPVFAILFKLLNPILPAQFQYFGFWGIVSFMLQGGLSCLILKKYIPNNAIVFSACPLFVCSTIVIFRMYSHTALAGQWIILLSFFVFVYSDKFKSLLSRTLWWCGICALSVSIHAYFIVMTGVIMVGFIIKDFIQNKKIIRPVLIFVSSVASTILTFWIIGGFTGGGEISEHGLGEYSMNMNSLFNSVGLGKFLLGQPLYSDRQLEGFQYLGFGLLILLPIVFFFLLSDLFNKETRNKINKSFFINSIPYAFVVFSLSVLALSPKVTLNKWLLVDYSGIKFITDILSTFRATGRFFWPVFYMIIFFIVIYLSKKAEFKNFVPVILIFCLALQLYDIKPLIKIRQTVTQPGVTVKYESVLKSDFWDNTKRYKHIQFLSDDIAGYEPLAKYASENNMTMNNGNIARKDFKKTSEKIMETRKKLISGDILGDTIYVVPERQKFLNKELEVKNVEELRIDGYYVFVLKHKK